MTIVHPKIEHRDGAFVFAHLLGFSCSVCAPATMSKAEVEAFAMTENLPPNGAVWVAIDKSKLGMGKPTPNPCNIESDHRQHWFLMLDK